MGSELERWARFEPPLLLQGGDLGAFLDRAFPGAVASEVEYIDRGVVNSNYRVALRWPDGTDGPGRVLLRLSRSDEGPRREGAVARRVNTARPDLAPSLLATETGERPERHRRSFFSWIEGRPIADVPAGASLERVAVELGTALAAFHRLDPGAFGPLDTEGRPAAGRSTARWADDLMRRVTRRLDNPAHGLAEPAGARLRAAFARNLGSLADDVLPPAALVHGDLSPGNILVRESGADWTLAGLVDWEMARADDPAADLATLQIEAPARLREFVTATEAAYRVALATAGLEARLHRWACRKALAAIPGLLDARMVAVRRAAFDTQARIDGDVAVALEAGEHSA